MEVKKDWLSGVLKVLLCFSFVYLWVMALVYVKKSYCGIPGAAVFLIAALLDGILVWCVWKKKKLKSDQTTTIKKENICLLCASLVLLALQFVVIWNAVFRTAWDPVSYTHLDVYKRQGIQYSGGFCDAGCRKNCAPARC